MAVDPILPEAIGGARVIRSHRRTLAIEIAHDGELIVRAPCLTSAEAIDRAVAGQKKWIARHRQRLLARRAATVAHRFVPGEHFLYLGAPYPLAIRSGARAPLTFERTFILSESHTHHPREALIGWYKREAGRIIAARVDALAARAGLAYTRCRVTDARRRWGSCGRGGSLSFAWRLVMAPLEVIDYVAAHELCHIVEPNHSSRFWRHVESLCPDYRARRLWLGEHGHLLTI